MSTRTNNIILMISNVIGIITILILMFTREPKQRDHDKQPTANRSYQRAAVITIDDTTGCHYLSTSSNGSITPRMNKAGKQICEP